MSDPTQSGPGEQDAIIQAGIEAAGGPNSKIGVIKYVRQNTGCGLKEAKDAVDDYYRRNGLATAGGAGCGSVLVLGALLWVVAHWR